MFCKICREYPSLADTSSSLFAGKKVDRKDTLLSFQLSAKHKVCTSKHELKSVKKVGTLDKAFAKVELSEMERYKNFSILPMLLRSTIAHLLTFLSFAQSRKRMGST